MSKIYGTSGNPVHALNGVSFGLPPGTFTAVMGPSGSGKSTLLHCAAGLDEPTAGTVVIDGTELTHGSETAMTKFRRSRIGFVFQQFNLLPTLTVRQNVTLPLRLAGRKIDEHSCGRCWSAPASATGSTTGQQQRVAIVRALVTRPNVIFVDEPTGALDTRSARDVLAMLADAVHTMGQTVVMVTHDPVAASYADSVIFLVDGRLVDRMDRPTAEAVAERMAHLGELVDQHLDAVVGE